MFFSGDIKIKMRQLFNVPEDVKTRLWSRYTVDTIEHLTRLEHTVYETGFFENQLLILEKQIDGKWAKED